MREAGDINASCDLGLPFKIQPSLALCKALTSRKAGQAGFLVAE